MRSRILRELAAWLRREVLGLEAFDIYINMEGLEYQDAFKSRFTLLYGGVVSLEWENDFGVGFDET